MDTEIETINDQMVASKGDDVIVMCPKHVMTKEEALRQAAWLVAITGDEERFKAILQAVYNTRSESQLMLSVHDLMISVSYGIAVCFLARPRKCECSRMVMLAINRDGKSRCVECDERYRNTEVKLA
jgi:hypothetical protein